MEASASEAAESAERSGSNVINIKVKTLGQAAYDLEVESDALIKDVKSQLAKAANTPANLQRLVFRGRILKDDQRLSSYDVVEASVIHMVTRPMDTSQQPPPAHQGERVHGAGAGPFTANMMGAQGMGVHMDMNDFGSFIANMLHTMGIHGAVHVTHTSVPSDAAGNVSPEQIAQAVAVQIAQQARQQVSHAGGEAPLPLLRAIQNYLQALESMYRGNRTVGQQLFDLPPVGQTAGTSTTFNVHQLAAAAREIIGDWELPQEARDFIASSAEPGFCHGPLSNAETPSSTSPAQGHAAATGSEQGSRTTETSTSAQRAHSGVLREQGAAAEEAAAAAQRDPRRNGMDNPFGDGRPEPMHPSLATLTEIAMQRLLRENVRFMQAASRVIGRLLLNRVPLQQERLFSNAELQGLAEMLHAEGWLLLESARAVSAYLMAQRNNSAAPLLNATAYHLRPDGRAPANTAPAALSSRRTTQERRNAIFINGGHLGGPTGAGRGQAAGAGGRGGPGPGAAAAAGRGRGTAQGAGAGQQGPTPIAMPIGGPFPALQAMMSGAIAMPMGPSRVVRVLQAEGGDLNNSLAIQIGDGATVQLDTTPLVQAFESVFANVPGIEELLRPLVAAPNTAPPTNAPPTNANLTTAPPNSAPPLPTASTQPGAMQNAAAQSESQTAAAGTPVSSDAPNPSAPADSSAVEQPSTARSFASVLPGLIQQVVPLFVGMLTAVGPGGTPVPAGTIPAAAGPTPTQQRGTQVGQGFNLPPFIMGPNNEVLVNVQTVVDGVGGGVTQQPEVQQASQIMEGIMFALSQAGFPMPPGTAPNAAHDNTQQQEQAPRIRRRRQDHISDESSENESAEEGSEHMEDPDGMRSAARRSDSGDLFRHCHLEEDDDDYEEEDEEDSERAMEHDGSDGWQTAEEDSDDEEQKWGGSTDGRNVESRREKEVPSTSATGAPHGASATPSSAPVPAPGAGSGPKSWPISNLEDSVSPATSPTPSAPIDQPPLQPPVSHPPVGLGGGLALPLRGGRRTSSNARGSTPAPAGNSDAKPGAADATPTPSMPRASTTMPGVEEIQRQSGSSASGPPNLGGLLSALLGGEAGGPAPGGNPQRTMHGPSSAGGGGAGGGLMDILQSPAMQQMANQLLGPPPGAPVSAPTAGSAPSAVSAEPAGGSLMGMMSQLAQSPAMQQMAEQLAGQMERGSSGGGQGGSRARSAAAGAGASPPDFGAFMQQMLPVVGQLLGGAGAGAGGDAVRSSAARAVTSSGEFAALDALPPEEANHWRQVIMADRAAQAEQPAADLSSTYLAGSRSAQTPE